jgi:hypothetical protein
MKKEGFTWVVQELVDPIYTVKALENEKESNKFYPGLKELNFDLYIFKLES